MFNAQPTGTVISSLCLGKKLIERERGGGGDGGGGGRAQEMGVKGRGQRNRKGGRRCLLLNVLATC